MEANEVAELRAALKRAKDDGDISLGEYLDELKKLRVQAVYSTR